MKAVIHFRRINKPESVFVETGASDDGVRLDYYLLDLMLDLWIAPDGSCKEMDWDEFDNAVRGKQITEVNQRAAVDTLRRMVDETRAGIFPWAYLPQTSQTQTSWRKP